MRPCRTRRLLVFLTVAVTACGTGTAPSAETEALEQWLLTAEEAGPGFAEAYRGTAGFGEGKICPASDYTIPSHGAVRVELVRGADADRIELSEVLWTMEAAEMEAFFFGMEGAYGVCDGEQWTDYGDVKVFSGVTAPDLGDESLAGRLTIGDDSAEAWQELTVTIRHAGILAEFTASYGADRAAGEPPISDANLFGIIADALDKLPD